MAMRRNYLYRLITRRVRTAKPRHAEAIRGNERARWRWNGARSHDEEEAFFSSVDAFHAARIVRYRYHRTHACVHVRARTHTHTHTHTSLLSAT